GRAFGKPKDSGGNALASVAPTQTEGFTCCSKIWNLIRIHLEGAGDLNDGQGVDSSASVPDAQELARLHLCRRLQQTRNVREGRRPVPVHDPPDLLEARRRRRYRPRARCFGSRPAFCSAVFTYV